MAHFARAALLLALCLAAAGLSAAGFAVAGLAADAVQAQPALAASPDTLTDGLSEPESVVYDAEAGGVYLVSNIAGSPFAADGEGFIARVAPSGRVLDRQWISGLDAPKGLALSGDTLYVTDLTRIRRFDRRSGAGLGAVSVPGAAFLNDLALAPNGALYASDTGVEPAEGGFASSGTAAIYRIAPGVAPERIASGDALGLPNGLAFIPGSDPDRPALLVSTLDGSGQVLRIDPEGRVGTYARVPTGALDGIAVLPGGTVLVSSWRAGTIYAVSGEGEAARLLATGLETPADFAVDGERGRLVVPLFTPGELRAVPLAQTPSASAALPSGAVAQPHGFAYPNGIAPLPGGGLAVGSVASGQVVRLAPSGEGGAQLFAGADAERAFAGTALALDAPRGLLWGASPDFLGRPGLDGDTAYRAPRVFARDASTGALRRSLTVPEGTFPNDLAVGPGGALYVTDSFGARILRLAPGADSFAVYASGGPLRGEGRIGPAGIALAPDGTLYVGLYGSGRIVRVRPLASQRGEPAMEAVRLPRALENPDGLALLPGGDLLVVEGAAASGDGRLLRLSFGGADGLGAQIETLASGLASPVNLTVEDDAAYVTESRIRHLLLPGAGLAAPTAFWVRRIPLR